VPTATPTQTPGGPTRTPTATPTPTVAPTAVPVTLLVPGGATTTDCITEWTVQSRALDPPPTTTVDCVDGDPSCDADGIADDICRFRVGICLAGTDPNLPGCTAAPGIVSFVLQSPQPGAANPVDAANSAALLTAIADLVGVAPGGTGGNTFTLAPPLVLAPPGNCTTPVTIEVERRGLGRRAERFRARATAANAGGGSGASDRDTLVLGCVAPNR